MTQQHSPFAPSWGCSHDIPQQCPCTWFCGCDDASVSSQHSTYRQTCSADACAATPASSLQLPAQPRNITCSPLSPHYSNVINTFRSRPMLVATGNVPDKWTCCNPPQHMPMPGQLPYWPVWVRLLDIWVIGSVLLTNANLGNQRQEWPWWPSSQYSHLPPITSLWNYSHSTGRVAVVSH